MKVRSFSDKTFLEDKEKWNSPAVGHQVVQLDTIRWLGVHHASLLDGNHCQLGYPWLPSCTDSRQVPSPRRCTATKSSALKVIVISPKFFMKGIKRIQRNNECHWCECLYTLPYSAQRALTTVITAQTKLGINQVSLKIFYTQFAYEWVEKVKSRCGGDPTWWYES